MILRGFPPGLDILAESILPAQDCKLLTRKDLLLKSGDVEGSRLGGGGQRGYAGLTNRRIHKL